MCGKGGVGGKEGGMHSWGACVVEGHAWQGGVHGWGVCMAEGGVHGQGACVVKGGRCAW